VMRKDFFGGLWSVNDWEWLWGRTIAQLELRTIDQPIIVYKADKDKKKPWEDGTITEEYANKAYQKWLEGKKKRDAAGIKFDMGQVKKVDFNEYLRTGEKKVIE